MENTFDGIALNTILIDIMKCILFNKILTTTTTKSTIMQEREKEKKKNKISKAIGAFYIETHGK